MPDTKLTDMTALTSLLTTHELYVNAGGSDRKITAQTLFNAINNLTDDTGLATGDFVAVYDITGTASVRATIAEILAVSHNHAASDIDSGTLAHERGGLEADVSAYSGLVAISGGATSEVDSKSELEAQIADVTDFAMADGDVYTGTHDFGGADDLEIPNSAAPTVDTDGQVALDTTVADFDEGVIKYFATAEMGVVAMPVAEFTSPTNGHVVAYNSTSNGFELVAQAGGGDMSASTYDPASIAEQLVGLTATQTLTNKTLTSPILGTSALDTNSNELFLLTATASAVNEVTYANAATGNDPTFTASGDDTNVGLSFQGKGTGNITLGNFVFDGDQSVGAGQDNYVLTYDDAGGVISLEAAAGAADNLGDHTATQDLAMAGFDIDDAGVIFLNEQAAANADVAGDGQIWVKDDTPNTLQFTDDAGTDFQIATLTGTETLSNKTIAGATVTGVVDAGGADSFELPNSATPTVDADGEIALDTTVTDFSHGVLKYYGGEEMAVIAVPIAELTTPTDGHLVSYNATNDEFELTAAGAADNLGDHTATQDLAMAGFDIDDVGVIFLNEQATANADVAGDGQIWVKTATPNQLWFTDDAGSDFQVAYREDDLSVFAATTSAQLAGVISDETGTGALMFATDPTLTNDLIFDEQADHSSTPGAGKGYLWVKNTAPSTLVFTDDTGSDVTLGSGSGNVSNTGTPVDNQIAVWTDATTIEGDTALTFDTATDTLSVGVSGTVVAGTIELGHASDTTLTRPSAGNVAVEGDLVCLLTATQTLTNKTLSSPTVSTDILDVNGNEWLSITATASAVNEITISNAATGNDPTFASTGGDTNIGVVFTPKGSGGFLHGIDPDASRYNEYVQGLDGAAAGEAQFSRVGGRGQTTDATETELFLDASSSRLTVPSNSALMGCVNIVGIKSDGTEADGFYASFGVYNASGTTSLFQAVTATQEGVSTWSVSITADDTNDALAIKVTGAASTTIDWVFTVGFTQVKT